MCVFESDDNLVSTSFLSSIITPHFFKYIFLIFYVHRFLSVLAHLTEKKSIKCRKLLSDKLIKFLIKHSASLLYEHRSYISKNVQVGVDLQCLPDC